MFQKILIANRGEIACRIIRTARRMGVQSVAVFSDADAAALHVEMADEAVHIGPPQPGESYLDGDKIIQAALDSGAEAIHPGYGFLSENPDFVDAVTAAGLVFIGPSAGAIRAMGLKDAAKILMEKAGVPVVPGYHGADNDGAVLQAEAAKIGYPVLVKAVAGGGGKGMRLVTAPADFPEALESARAEARSAFGNDAVLIEKFVEKPRHIEIQVFGDGTDAIHLYERDCSLQRRHQKVLEEAPAPGMTAEMRGAMGQAAVRAARAIDYQGAGTVEFIVDASEGLRPDRFWFMEMNTRLQVEHPVTEAVTGVDLVEWQLRVAAGEALPARQEDLRLDGHAIEARLYAEDPQNGFLPVTGRLARFRPAPLARTDTGIRDGDVVSPFYDPMIAKIIVHGPSRDIALTQLSSAISATEIAGTVTNRAFLKNLVENDAVRKGDVDTGLIDRDLPALTQADTPDQPIVLAAVLCAAGLWEGADDVSGFTLWTPLRHDVHLMHGPDAIQASVQVSGPDRVVVSLDGADGPLERIGGAWFLRGRKLAARPWRAGSMISVFSNDTWHFTHPDPLDRQDADATGSNVVLAPMPGLLKSVHVEAGARVARGARLMVLEAMKMEHALTAARDGIVAEVLGTAGQQVEAGVPLIRLEDEE